ncbi:hypothetical protein RCL_jg17010.t1 [Rhizophagus clarus]|uniref:Uncharacterized protein n=1 Tax=Rhizophagus clarus TaxID=94130 RepID=A0A8H3QQB5_9GLOM|nr:hypothetical protein RCL_jg17010.t1 [Rhizophagus clarus]
MSKKKQKPAKKQLIEDLIEAFATADIPLEKKIKLYQDYTADSAAYMKKCHCDVLSPLMPQLTHRRQISRYQ